MSAIHLNVKVPKKLSDWAELALKDAIAVSKRKGVRFDMNKWIDFAGSKCSVCLAGAVMLRRMPAENLRQCRDFGAYLWPQHFNGDPRMEHYLGALNYLRTGCTASAVSVFTGRGFPFNTRRGRNLIEASRYWESLERFNPKFRTEMRRRIKVLRELGF